jgi:Maltokinase N-terminal cap domain
MAIIHRTTLVPGKLDLLAGWLPAQPWYRDPGRESELAKAGGFRLDDPQGEVGIEFMVVTDGSGDRAVAYLVPLTYRASALAGADGGLIGTAEHGVLGRRWVYDGTHDPVLVAQLVALIQGNAEPQAQSASSMPDPTVTSNPVTSGALTASEARLASNGAAGTDLVVGTSGADGGGQLLIRVSRVLEADFADDGTVADEAGGPCLSAPWRRPDGTQVRGSLAFARYTPATGARP